MNNKFIIINGSGGVGKDTFVELCEKYNKDIIHISSITPAVELAKSIGWNGIKTEKDRKFLSDLKKCLDEWKDISINYIRDINSLYNNKIIFVDIREPKNIERAKDIFNAITLLIENPRVEKINSNESDKNVLNYDYDYKINNFGTLNELSICAEEFIKLVTTK